MLARSIRVGRRTALSSFCILLLMSAGVVKAQTENKTSMTDDVVKQLMDRLSAAEAEIQHLKTLLGAQPAPQPVPTPADSKLGPNVPATVLPTEPAPSPAVDSPPPPEESHDHMMEIPGGPALHFRGFFDFNFGVGQAANNLIFPLGVQAHPTFQSGEFDLFMSSQLSPKLSFVSELVIGSDPTNYWGLDIERLQLTYKQSDYFQISAGRFHTSIGYYNTTFHHGTWFSTATGRPFMYLFEDSGGPLPVHDVGVTMTGLVPGTGKWNLHWVAEGGNGRNSLNFGQPVQNFLSDRSAKDYNLAAYIKPDWASGLQIGGSFYRDRLEPAGIPHVQQTIASVYGVYMTPKWEFMNEAVLLQNKISNGGRTYRSPLMYTQLARKFGIYKPYVRFQEVNIPNDDPVSVFTGRYEGPSFGLRIDAFDYAAFKIQYNRVYLRNMPAENGLLTQVSFTF